MSNLGETEYIGQNSNCSYHGHTIGRLKSLMQKSVRRRDKQIINWVAFEIASFHRLYLFVYQIHQLVKQSGWKDIIDQHAKDLVQRVLPKKLCVMDTTDKKNPKKIAPIFTKQTEWIEWLPTHLNKIASALRNIAHRILIISTEDCFDIWIPQAIDEDMRTICQHPEHPQYGILLCQVLNRLIDSNKIRLVSDIKSAYLLMMANKPSNQKFLDRYHSLRKDPSLFGFDTVQGAAIQKVMNRIHNAESEFSSKYQDEIDAMLIEKKAKKVKLNRKIVKKIDSIIAAFLESKTGTISDILKSRAPGSNIKDYISDMVDIHQPYTEATKKKLEGVSKKVKKNLEEGFQLYSILDEDSEISLCSKGIIYYLLHRSDMVFYWVARLMRIKLKCQHIGRRKKCIYLLWLIIENIHQLEPSRDISSLPWVRSKVIQFMIVKLKAWYDDGNLGGLVDAAGKEKEYILPEANLFLYYAITIYVRQDLKNTKGAYVLKIDPAPVAIDNIPTVKEFNMLSKLNPSIPGYARDMHDTKSKLEINSWIQSVKTSISKMSEANVRQYLPTIVDGLQSIQSYQPYFDDIRDKIEDHSITKSEITKYLNSEYRNATHFARYGAYVVDENKQLVDSIYRSIYESLKGMSPNDVSSFKFDKEPDSVDSSGSDQDTQSIMLPDIISVLEKEPTQDMQGIPVFGISPQIENNIATAIRGQKLCGTGKIPVSVFKHHVIKGPYHLSKTGEQLKFKLNIANTRAMLILDKTLDESLKSCVPWLGILRVDDTDAHYLVMENVGSSTVDIMNSSEADTSIETGKHIVCRGSLVDSVYDYLKQSEDSKDSKYIVIASLQYLYFRYLLGIGDSNLRNILVRRDFNPPSQPRYIAGIDMEEIRRSYPPEGSTRMQLLFAGSKGTGLPTKTVLTKLDKYIGDISLLAKDDQWINDTFSAIYKHVFDSEQLVSWLEGMNDRKVLFAAS